MRDGPGDDLREVLDVSPVDKCPDDDAEEYDLAMLSGNDDGLDPCGSGSRELPSAALSGGGPGIGIGEGDLL
jgi:hypothetical protein